MKQDSEPMWDTEESRQKNHSPLHMGLGFTIKMLEEPKVL